MERYLDAIGLGGWMIRPELSFFLHQPERYLYLWKGKIHSFAPFPWGERQRTRFSKSTHAVFFTHVLGMPHACYTPEFDGLLDALAVYLDTYAQQLTRAPTQQLLYSCDATYFYRLARSPESSLPAFQLIYPPSFGQKILPYPPYPTTVPADLSALLYQLTGGDTSLVTQLFVMLARIGSTQPGMTILYSPLHTALLGYLLTALMPALLHVVVPMSSSGERVNQALTLTQLTTKATLRQLFVMQAMGCGGIVVKGVVPSPTVRRTVRGLLRGKPVTKGSAAPYQNRLHFVCIATDYAQMNHLRSAFPTADWIDFSKSELPPAPPRPLKPDAIAWIYDVACPYGLAQINAPVAATDAPPISEDAYGINGFVTCCCHTKDTTADCSSFDLYEAYLAYYKNCYPNQEIPLTKVRFIKQVRSQLGRQPLQDVRYEKRRKDATSAPIWQFHGLTLSDCPPAPVTAVNEATVFHQKLLEIQASTPYLQDPTI